MSQHKSAAEMGKKTQEENGRWSERGCHRVTWHTGLKNEAKDLGSWTQRIEEAAARYGWAVTQQQQHVLPALSADDTNTCSVRLFSCTWFSLLMVNNNNNNNKTICAKRLQMQSVGLILLVH